MLTYSFADVSFLVNGIEIDDYDEGNDVIQIRRLVDAASHKTGANGRMALNISSNRSGEGVFRVLQNSASSDYLNSLAVNQETGIIVPVFFQFKDTRNNEIGSGSFGYIPKPADIVRGDGINGEEWRIIVERLDFIRA